MSKTKIKLVPPDLERCQVETLAGSFMTLGPRSWERCRKVPVWIALEREPGTDGQRGSMSMCEECRKKFIEFNGRKLAKFRKILKISR